MRHWARGISGQLVVLLAFLVGLDAARAGADDTFFLWKLADLKGDEIKGGLEIEAAPAGPNSRIPDVRVPYVVLDGAGEAYLNARSDDNRDVYFRVPDGNNKVTGRLVDLRPGGQGMRAFRFSVTPPASKEEAKRAFARAKSLYYSRLLALNLPGAVWFRHQQREAEAMIGLDENSRPATNFANRPGTDLDATFDFFSGNRAVEENLQLDRSFEAAGSRPIKGRTTNPVQVDSIAGISVAEMDWTKRLEGRRPKLDPLADKIPADQHAVFFPSLRAAAGLLAQFQGDAAPVLRLFDARSRDRGDQARYERQLGLSVAELGKFSGLDSIRTVAVTGSDPYFPEGTDLAILFQTDSPDALAEFLKAKLDQARRADPEAIGIVSELDGIRYSGARTPDRSLCSYVATMGKVVVITNSLAQLKRLNRSALGEIPVLVGQPEYRFFRDRYPIGEGDESAFLILTDATIRRWCGPRWRIGESRRVRASALLAEAQAANFNAIASGTTQGVKPVEPSAWNDLGPLRLGQSGVRSEEFGTVNFLTPIVELPLDEVGDEEARSYARWRDTYQRNWRGFFDPIALRLSARPGKVAADLSVIPLIANTEYQYFIATIGKVRIEPGAGDPHPGTLAHAIMAIDTRSGVIEMCRDFIAGSLSIPKDDALGWLGGSFSVYLDDDPFWAQLMAAKDTYEFFDKNGHRTPVGVQFEVTDGQKLTRFLDVVWRKFSDPNLWIRNEHEYHGKRYVEIAEADYNPPLPRPKRKVYYYGSARSLTFSLSEDLVKRAIDRDQPGAKPGGEVAPWPRESLALRANRLGFEVLGSASRVEQLDALRSRSWGNLPILNEWKRRFPDRDPVAIHEAFSGVTLIDPCGGRYVWNERWATMESTVLGHPGEPRSVPENFDPVGRFRLASFGLTFEDKGLRAKTEIELTPQP
jgi:hypothetical protein